MLSKMRVMKFYERLPLRCKFKNKLLLFLRFGLNTNRKEKNQLKDMIVITSATIFNTPHRTNDQPTYEFNSLHKHMKIFILLFPIK